MKIAHICHFSPMTNGMYESARDLCAAERRIGVDARLVDVRTAEMAGAPALVRPDGKPCERCGHVRLASVSPGPVAPDWAEDRGVVLAPLTWLEECDAVVSHSGMPPQMMVAASKPRIHVAHGRPRSSFLLGQMEGNHVWAAYAQYAKDPRFKALVTLWPGFARYWRMVFPRVEELRPFVDLERWHPGATGHGFSGKGGQPNVVITDVWRHDRDPFHCLFGFAQFAERVPGARLHLYGLNPRDAQALGPILDGLQRRGVLGEVCGRRNDLLGIYGSADLLLTPHAIATRTVREAQACGLTVVAGGPRYTPYSSQEEDLDGMAGALERAWAAVRADPAGARADARARAEAEFDPEPAARRMAEMLGEIIGQERAKGAAA